MNRENGEDNEIENTVVEQQENITFGDTDPAPADELKILEDQTRYMRDDAIAHLGTYLSRPVLINTFTWTQATTGTDLNGFWPWQAFFNDARIKSKLNNFARITCKLRLKFLMNASPFYYGLLKVNYDPLSTGRAFDTGFLTQSQLPGPYIAPQEMTSVEMELPFFWPRDYLDICDEQNFVTMGQIYYNVFEQLKSANDSTAGVVTISCYAWAEDVHLAAPTSYNALQGPKKTGPVSRIANTVSRVAGAMSAVPPLSGIATAVSTGASVVSSLATALGFSNAPNVNNVEPVQNKTFHAFANTEQQVPLDKLSLDPKNEVSLGSETVGLGNVDELAVGEFVSHEAWIGRVSWDSSATSGTHLMTFFVTPHLQQTATYSDPSRQSYAMTPTRYLSRFFKYWRGSMIYRIKIVGTKYHKGRLQITWDPEDTADSNSDIETTNITKIVDLDAEREIEFAVPFKAVRAWNNTNFEDQGSLPIKYGAGSFSRIPNRAEHNGAISIFIQNQLSAPIDPSDVAILVYARGGPDFEVARPVETIRRYSPNAPQGPKTLDGDALANEVLVTAYTVGERISSIRQLLHRTVCYGLFPRINTTQQGLTSNLALWMTQSIFPKVPRCWGYDPTGGIYQTYGIVIPATVSRSNRVYETPTDAFTNCFAGYRGSVNWHVAPLQENADDLPLMSISRAPGTHSLNAGGYTAANFSQPINMLQTVSTKAYPGDLASEFAGTTVTGIGGRIANVDHGLGGLSLANTRTQPYISVNIPQYGNTRFQNAWIGHRDALDTDTFRDCFTVTSVQRIATAYNRYYTMYTSAGVDYNLFYFICCPLLWNYDMPATEPV